MQRPKHLSGPQWDYWTALYAPAEIRWSATFDCMIAGRCVAVLEARPYHCDRGHFIVKCFLPGLDEADGFPRYYMNKEIAIKETEAFLRWRLWKIRE